MPAAGTPVKDFEVKKGFFSIKRVEITRGPSARGGARSREACRRTRIGIPRVLNIYSTAPYFRTYFEALGIPKQNVVFSDETTRRCGSRAASTARSTRASPRRWRRRTSTTCSSTTTPDEKKPLQYIFFPILTHVPSFGEG
jgi:predicted nucleotide-binding protein (sugar kinase/HSP70/actin superfamily)